MDAGLANEDFDSLLARIQEESLRHYNEVELPRISALKENDVGTKYEDGKNDDEKVSPRGEEKVSGKEIDQENDKDVDYSFMENLFHKGKDAEGFHLAAGSSYIYPSNYPIRKYQADIIPTALFHNTLVSLPTGMGKTFIGAVVMYNFYRWYPMGKVIFMAPTRPLVTQQLSACRDIMGIPSDDTVELTGSTVSAGRKELWETKRVFYLTPQVMMNDLRSSLFSPSLVKCLVIDEAHRATKGYAYCQVVKCLYEEGVTFRILALSATPGTDAQAVKEVIQNLHIEKLEVRSEDSEDIVRYSHSKSVTPVIVELPPYLRDIWNKYMEVYDNYVRKIRELKVLTQNVATLSKFQMLTALRKFTSKPPATLPQNVVQSINGDFNICITLAHGRELLQTYGLRTFHSYFTEAENASDRTSAMTRLCHDGKMRQLLGRIQEIIFKEDGGDLQKYTWSHPKMEQLVSIVKEHFENKAACGESTKAIVFCQYRLVVTEVFEILGKFVPLAKPAMFIGQGSKEKGQGLPQKKQIEIMEMFRAGEYNVLVATSVAEEGLDIGEVDLIVSAETHRSPIRLVQRFGRTGRKRSGRCIVLLTSGAEVKKFNEVMATHKNYTSIISSPLVRACLETSSPRMIPSSCDPKQQLLHIKVPEQKTDKKKQVDIRNAIGRLPLPRRDNMPPPTSAFLTDEEMSEVRDELGSYILNFNRLPSSSELWPRRKGTRLSIEEFVDGSFSKFSSWLEWNNKPHKTYVVGHSKDTDMLVHLLQKGQELRSKQTEPCMDLSRSPESLWSTVGARAVKKKNEEVPKKAKNNAKHNGKFKYGLDIRSCMASAAEKAKLPSQECLSGVWFNTPAHGGEVVETGGGEGVEPAAFDDDVVVVTSPRPDEMTVILDENMNSLLDDILQGYDNICDKLFDVCTLSKDIEICGTVARHVLLPSTGDYKIPSISSYLPNICDLLEDINIDDIKKCDLEKLPCMKNKLQKTTGKYHASQHDICDVKMDSVCKASPTYSEPDIIGIDDIFNAFDVDSFNSSRKNSLKLEDSVPKPNNRIDEHSGDKIGEEVNIDGDDDRHELSPILTQNVKIKKVTFDKSTRKKTEHVLHHDNRNCEFDDVREMNMCEKSCEIESFIQDDLDPVISFGASERTPINLEKCKNGKRYGSKSAITHPKDISIDGMDISPIISCRVVDYEQTPVNLMEKRNGKSPVLSGSVRPSQTKLSSKMTCSTPKSFIKKDLFKSTKPKDVDHYKQSENHEKTDKKEIDEFFKEEDDMLCNDLDFKGIDDFFGNPTEHKNEIDSSSDSNDVNESWSIDQILRNSASKDSPATSTPKKLSYYLNGDSLYSVTQLVEKAIELETNQNKQNLQNKKKGNVEIKFEEDNKIDNRILNRNQNVQNEVKNKVENEFRDENKVDKSILKTNQNKQSIQNEEKNKIETVFREENKIDNRILKNNQIDLNNQHTEMNKKENEALEEEISKNECILNSSDDDIFGDLSCGVPYAFKNSSKIKETEPFTQNEIPKNDSLHELERSVSPIIQTCKEKSAEKPKKKLKLDLSDDLEIKLERSDSPIIQTCKEKSAEKPKKKLKFDLSSDFEIKLERSDSPIIQSCKEKSAEKPEMKHNFDLSDDLENKFERSDSPIIQSCKEKSAEKPKRNLKYDLSGVLIPSQDISVNRSNFECDTEEVLTQNRFADSPLFLPYECKVSKQSTNAVPTDFESYDLSSHYFERNNVLKTNKCKIGLSLKRKIEANKLKNNSSVKEDRAEEKGVRLNEQQRKTNADGSILSVRDKSVSLDVNNQSSSSDVIKPKLYNRRLVLEESDIVEMPSICEESRNENVSFTYTNCNKSAVSHNTTNSMSKSKTFLECSDSDSDIFVRPNNNRNAEVSSEGNSSPEINDRKKQKSKGRRNQFIENEADVSGETSSGNETSGLDSLDESFIDDQLTQHVDASIIVANYLQSVKTLKRVPGGYKIPELSERVMARDVYSQAVPLEHETYINDSFCVSEPETGDSDGDLSELEIAEKLLARRNKKKKKTKFERHKRKRGVSSSGSDTDFELSAGGSEDAYSAREDGVERFNRNKKKRRKVIIPSDSD